MEVCRCLIKQNYDKWQNCVGVWVKGTEGKERFLWKLRQPPLDVKFYNLMMRLQPNHKALFQKGFLFSDNYIIAAHEGSFVCVTKAAWHVPLSCLLVINFVLLTLRKTAFCETISKVFPTTSNSHFPAVSDSTLESPRLLFPADARSPNVRAAAPTALIELRN